jgi:hypothetical protein
MSGKLLSLIIRSILKELPDQRKYIFHCSSTAIKPLTLKKWILCRRREEFAKSLLPFVEYGYIHCVANLLYDIISKHISHQRTSIRKNLWEYLVFLFHCCSFQLLLYKPTTILIRAACQRKNCDEVKSPLRYSENLLR